MSDGRDPREPAPAGAQAAVTVVNVYGTCLVALGDTSTGRRSVMTGRLLAELESDGLVKIIDIGHAGAARSVRLTGKARQVIAALDSLTAAIVEAQAEQAAGEAEPQPAIVKPYREVTPVDKNAATAAALGLLTDVMQHIRVAAALADALREAGCDVPAAAATPGLLERWTATEGEARAALLLAAAWGSRANLGVCAFAGIDMAGQDARSYADELTGHAVLFAGDIEEFHGAAFPAQPLPGPAGGLASRLGLDPDPRELEISLRTMLALLTHTVVDAS